MKTDHQGLSDHCLGSTVPVKFHLKDTKAGKVDTTKTTLTVTKLSGTAIGTVLETEVILAASCGNAFKYDATSGQYQHPTLGAVSFSFPVIAKNPFKSAADDSDFKGKSRNR